MSEKLRRIIMYQRGMFFKLWFGMAPFWGMIVTILTALMLLLSGCSMTPKPNVVNLVTIVDADGVSHTFPFGLKLNDDNWCEIHQQYEYVEVKTIIKPTQ